LVQALDLAIERQARAPVILRVTEVAGYTDWVMIVSGRSDRQVRAISERIHTGLREQKTRPLGTDGDDAHVWTLLDYDDFMIHVFYHPLRIHFDLESMWSDAPRVTLDLPADVMDTSDLDGFDTPEVLSAYRGDETFGGYDDEFDDEVDDWDADGAVDDDRRA
jgi:ribosome-associated protein